MKNLPERKHTRLKDYDYSQAGAYFITICVKDKQKLLGSIVGGNTVGGAARCCACSTQGDPYIELTEIGESVKRRIEHINDFDNAQTLGDIRYGCKVEKYVIMPNHVHLLITITGGSPSVAQAQRLAATPTMAIIPRTVNALKSLTSKEFGKTLWQRSYHDHIIRNENDYQRIWQYIDDNPIRWADDRYYF
jgi:REP element-mobilizing transposase RayT